jgi:hypothetical protein
VCPRPLCRAPASLPSGAGEIKPPRHSPQQGCGRRPPRLGPLTCPAHPTGDRICPAACLLLSSRDPHLPFGPPLTNAAYGSDDSVGAFVFQMTVDNEQGMKYTGYPEQQSQNEVQNSLNRLAAKQNGQRWKDNGQKVSHFAPSAHELEAPPETMEQDRLRIGQHRQILPVSMVQPPGCARNCLVGGTSAQLRFVGHPCTFVMLNEVKHLAHGGR